MSSALAQLILPSMDLERLLHRLPDLKLHLDARGEVRVDISGRTHHCGPRALRLLEIFTVPHTVAQALETLKPELSGTQDWMLALRTIQQLEESGVLVSGQPAASSAAFDQPSLHIAMLNDHGRTSSFIGTIRKLVQPGHVVADIGTGTGVLAATAALAGAKKVYAIEAGSIRSSADALFRHNSLAEKVTLLPGWSTQISLPEQTDLIIGELLGNDPFGEDVIEIYRDAVRRFLKPGGKCIPSEVALWGVIMSIPPEVTRKYRFEPETSRLWNAEYGLRFDCLQRQESSIVFTTSPQNARHWRELSAPFRVRHADLLSGQETQCASRIESTVSSSGTAEGILYYFTAKLSDDVTICTRPEMVQDDCHWRNVVVLRNKGLSVQAGDPLIADLTEGYRSVRFQKRA